MFKLRWTNTTTGKSDFVRTEKGIRAYKTEAAAIKAIKKFKEMAPAEIEYSIEK